MALNHIHIVRKLQITEVRATYVHVQPGSEYVLHKDMF